MERDILRLECLKLAATRTTDQKEILSRAEQFEAFILKDVAPVNGVKHIGNAQASESVGVTVGKTTTRP